MTDPIPSGTEGRVIPYLMIKGAAAAIDFYKEAFGAEERYRMEMPDGGIGHADLLVNGAPVYLADVPEDVPGRPRDPNQLGATSVLPSQPQRMRPGTATTMAIEKTRPAKVRL